MTERRKNPTLVAAQQRRTLFIAAYLAPGEHQYSAEHAAIAAGFSAKNARSAGGRLMCEEGVAKAIAEAARRTAAAAELTTARTLREVGHILHNDPRRFYNDDGSLKPPKEWDDDMAACVASVEMGAEVVGMGEAAHLEPYVKKIKWWSKLDAADKVMRHQGLFEKDNRQRQENLAIQINLVGGPEPRATNGSGVQIQANLVGPKTNGSNGSHL
jgi:phage terminase small subunit